MSISLFKSVSLILWLTILTPCCVSLGAESDSGSRDGTLSRNSLSLDDEPVILARYRTKLDNLMATCRELDMSLEAEVTETSLRPVGLYGVYILDLKAAPVPESLPPDAKDLQKKWYAALRRLQQTTATALTSLAQLAADKGQGYDAMRLVFQALEIDPNCEPARRILGFELHQGRWRSEWERGQLAKGAVDHPVFGWIPAEQVEEYEAGLRSQSASDKPNSDRLAQDSSRNRLETEHFSLLCSGDRGEEVRLSRLLEDYFQAWFQLFYPFIGSEQYWSNYVAGRQKLPRSKMKVVVFANRAEYLKELGKSEPNLEYSHGGYFPGKECIYVYWPGPEEETHLDTMLVHEATHQLFQEYRYGRGQTRKAKRQMAGQRDNFWMVEGIATYAETFRRSGRFFQLGGADTWRFQRAKERVSEPGGYLPLQRYVRLSLNEFQTHDNIPMLYTQSTGLTVFFLHGKDGKYRRKFLDCLRLLYDDNAGPDSLAETLQTDLTTLDEEYKQFMLAAPVHKWP
ncbi:MAG: hypothetical protein Q4G68_11915 [Planctomycetia bacterium]|nr:hypothetical protein [Planctomycetia bacterium]